MTHEVGQRFFAISFSQHYIAVSCLKVTGPYWRKLAADEDLLDWLIAAFQWQVSPLFFKILSRLSAIYCVLESAMAVLKITTPPVSLLQFLQGQLLADIEVSANIGLTAN